MLHDVTDLILIHFELVQGSGLRGTVKLRFTFAKHTDEVIVEKFAFSLSLVETFEPFLTVGGKVGVLRTHFRYFRICLKVFVFKTLVSNWDRSSSDASKTSFSIFFIFQSRFKSRFGFLLIVSSFLMRWDVGLVIQGWNFFLCSVTLGTILSIFSHSQSYHCLTISITHCSTEKKVAF